MEKKNYKKYLTTAFLVFIIVASIASVLPLLGLSYYDHRRRMITAIPS